MEINVFERFQVIRCHKCQGFLGLHILSGADWGRTFVGISKKTLVNTYLKPDNDDKAISKGSIPPELINGELPSTLQSLKHFACRVYISKGQTNLCLLRWELFLSKNLEGEMLPPT